MSNKSFAETAMELSGKTKEESKSIGKVDTADDQVENLFKEKHKTSHSPVHRAVWDREFPTKEFLTNFSFEEEELKVTKDCFEVLKDHKINETLYDSETGKLSKDLLNDLSKAGYFGLLVPIAPVQATRSIKGIVGKSSIPFSRFAPFLSKMAMLEPSVAGLASVHGCIGAVDPIKTFGNKYQKEKWLPLLASGEKLSAFALTEPCAGSDMTALKTTATLEDDHYVVNGEKLFITNAICGRLISLVCLIDNEPQVLIVELPEEENAHFQLKKYGLYALSRLNNNGLVFKNFKVPKENLIKPNKGNGLTIAYHGLNLGRIALCANAAGCMNVMLWSMLPWSNFRITYGQPIAKRELVQNRIAKLAGYILSSNSLVSWCSSLIDQGYRGELECIVAKTFGSEKQKESAIDLCMKTHGGRSFLHGHLIGDNIHEFLAPLIYEGEGDMLNMAFFKSLVKEHGVKYFEPIGKAMMEAGIKKPSPIDMIKNYKVFLPYVKWLFKEKLHSRYAALFDDQSFPPQLKNHADFAIKNLQKVASEISSLMRRYQLRLADKQCRMSLLSHKIQNLITMLATIGYTATHYDEITEQIADVACDNLKNEILGKHPNDYQIRKSVKLGEKISDEDFVCSNLGPKSTLGTILMNYKQ